LTCTTEFYSAVVEAIEAQGISIEVKEVARVPSSTVEVDAETAVTLMKLLEKLEDHDDVQSVASNVNFSPEQLASFG
jgi:transcriptional/translational regulatory protein YebC/TACO1